LAIGLPESKVKNIVKNKKLAERFMQILDIGNVTTCEKEMGSLFEACATKVKEHLYPKT
jgi:hypothetical protein